MGFPKRSLPHVIAIDFAVKLTWILKTAGQPLSFLILWLSLYFISISSESVFPTNSTVASSTRRDEMKQVNKNIHSLNIPWISKSNFENGFKCYMQGH